MARRDKEEFDWLDDPFNDKKAQQQQAGMSGNAKMAVGCGCLLVVAAMVVLLVFAGASFMDIMADL